jgi:transposase
MTKQRRSFSTESKREAAADLVLKQNYSYIEASRSLGVGKSALRRGLEQFRRNAKASPLIAKRCPRCSRKFRSLKPGSPALKGKIDTQNATVLLMSEDHECRH